MAYFNYLKPSCDIKNARSVLSHVIPIYIFPKCKYNIEREILSFVLPYTIIYVKDPNYLQAIKHSISQQNKNF